MFSALVATTRTLRLRRNVVKLALYRHFANTLVLSVIASVVFMMWNIKFHRLEECLKGACRFPTQHRLVKKIMKIYNLVIYFRLA